jgi:2,3-dihydroxybiphenyl 1,2-dioxygenase
MTLQSLGYVGVRSDRIGDWADYGEAFLGLQLVERSRSLLRFRMDDRKQRIVVTREQDAEHLFGFEVESLTAAEALAGRLEAANVPVRPLPASDLALRGITGGIRFADPAGTALEAFWGPEAADTPFRAGRAISGFRTGTLGMGHVVLHVPRIDDLRWFYEDVLGFRLSDYTTRPFKACFFHLNPRHHSLAMIETGKSGVHHLMMELNNLDDVGQGYDIALGEKGRIATTLGRHINDLMTSFYARTPGDFMIEYGWGGKTIDPATWQPGEVTYGPSLWGHDRNWLPAEQMAEARALRMRAAADGERAPVQVADGNFNVGFGDCPWWSNMRRTGV